VSDDLPAATIPATLTPLPAAPVPSDAAPARNGDGPDARAGAVAPERAVVDAARAWAALRRRRPPPPLHEVDAATLALDRAVDAFERAAEAARYAAIAPAARHA